MKNKTFMKNKTLLSASLALMMAMPMQAQRFEDNFEDKTLRLDYIVAGDSERGQTGGSNTPGVRTGKSKSKRRRMGWEAQPKKVKAL